MTFKVRKTVVVGLGGAGRDAVLNVKRMCLEAYGTDALPTIKYFVLDTSDPEGFTLPEGREIRLQANEFLRMAVDNPDQIVRMNPEVRSWFPVNGVPLASIRNGAGQVRALGRLALFANGREVYERLKNTLEEIRAHRPQRDFDQFDHMDDTSVLVHVVGSLAGGTGSGTFLDVAYICRQHMQETDTLVAHLLLPDVFVGKPATNNVQANAYGALKELDYLMGMHPQPRTTYEIGGYLIRVTTAPFDVINLVNNRNRRGEKFQTVQELTELLGMGIFVSSGAAGESSGDMWDKVKFQITASSAIEGKCARYTSFGVSELVLDTVRLAEQEGHRLAIKAVENTFLGIRSAAAIINGMDEIIVKTGLCDYEPQQVIDVLCRDLEVLARKPLRPFTIELGLPAEYTVSAPVTAEQFLVWLREYGHEVQQQAPLNLAEVARWFLRFARSHPGVRRIAELNIEQVLRGMSRDDLVRRVQELHRVSIPMWQYNPTYVKGRQATTIMYLFGVENADLTLLSSGLTQQMLMLKEPPHLVTTSDRRRLFCYQLEAAVPAFAISGMEHYKLRYDHPSAAFCYHVSQEWETTLPDLWPNPNADQPSRRGVRSLAKAVSSGQITNLRTELQSRYYDQRDHYERLASALQAALVNLLTEAGIQYLAVAARIKQFDSFFEKVFRKGYSAPFDETEDLCGLRVICYYPSDVQRVCELIRSEFHVEEGEDKSSLLPFNQFGYRSVHFIVRAPRSWAGTANYRGLEGLKAEVQVRTVLMHAWAEIEHKLAYKSKAEVPDLLKRKLSVLSAKLEEADDQLESLRTQSEDW